MTFPVPQHQRLQGLPASVASHSNSTAAPYLRRAPQTQLKEPDAAGSHPQMNSSGAAFHHEQPSYSALVNNTTHIANSAADLTVSKAPHQHHHHHHGTSFPQSSQAVGSVVTRTSSFSQHPAAGMGSTSIFRAGSSAGAGISSPSAYSCTHNLSSSVGVTGTASQHTDPHGVALLGSTSTATVTATGSSLRRTVPHQHQPHHARPQQPYPSSSSDRLSLAGGRTSVSSSGGVGRTAAATVPVMMVSAADLDHVRREIHEVMARLQHQQEEFASDFQQVLQTIQEQDKQMLELMRELLQKLSEPPVLRF